MPCAGLPNAFDRRLAPDRIARHRSPPPEDLKALVKRKTHVAPHNGVSPAPISKRLSSQRSVLQWRSVVIAVRSRA